MGIDTGTQYLNVVGNPYAGQSLARWIKPAAFQRPADGNYGNEHRNALRLPGINNWDTSLSKTVSIGERVNAIFRADAFNVLNHPQIWTIYTGFRGGNPGGPISASNKTFGQPSSYRDNRIFQVSMKVSF